MVQIYRVAEKENSPSYTLDEVCRKCALEFQAKGLSVHIDDHLERYVYAENGITYYEDGSDEVNEEIVCSVCGEHLISDTDVLIDGTDD